MRKRPDDRYDKDRYDKDRYGDYDDYERRRRPRRRRSGRGVLIGFVLGIAAVAAVTALFNYVRTGRNADTASTVSSSPDHDVTLDKKTYADYSTPLLGEAKRSSLLTVEERSVSVIVNNTQEGIFDWDILKKSEAVRYYGTAQYTVDLSDFSEDDIAVDHDAKTVTVTIPDAELHSVTVDPDKTEVLSQNNGLLAWGSLELSTEEQQKVEAAAVDAMEQQLTEENALDDARRFAHLTAWEIFWPVVSSVSEENGESYTLIINETVDAPTSANTEVGAA